MNYYVDIDPYAIMERDRQIRSGVQTLYLEQRLRKNRKASHPLLTHSIKQGRQTVGGASLSH